MGLPPYSKRAHAQALVMSGLLLGLDRERIDREVSEDTGLNTADVRAEIDAGDYDPAAVEFLTIFDSRHDGLLMKVAAQNILSGLLGLS